MLGVPMVADDRVVGVIGLWRVGGRTVRRPTIGLVTTFAAQGVIAIQNVELFQELQQRGRELAHSVDELQALGEVSQAVSSSLDLDEVLTTIVTRAAELPARTADRSSSSSRRRPSSCCARASARAELVDALRRPRIGSARRLSGGRRPRGEVRQAADLELEPPDPHIDELRRHGWRSMAAVPLRREEEIIGALIVRRKTPGALLGRR